ncbi:MAG: hypothetical protein JSW61_06855 [Candidatus Thorarchaeota archaeon]|nr:MAG: hypothetical protein JSW61_06855 [Candidatus Thorarchaeota archaeon]
MDLLKACLNHDGAAASETVAEMVANAQPSATWAVLMHAAAWNEQREFDTPHSTILTFSIHRMIEDLGQNARILNGETGSGLNALPRKFRESLQSTLIERLAYHLADVDHWVTEAGPRYDIDIPMDSLDNALGRYTGAIRERRQIRAAESALRLASRENPIRLLRSTASMAAEEPDKLGHAFIMPLSLLLELPQSRFTRPIQASIWHLTEYLVRKIPRKREKEFVVDERMDQMAEPTDLSAHKVHFMNSIVQYGILGHNGIFAHRIAEAAEQGIVNSSTVEWLLSMLKRNIGEKRSQKQLDARKLSVSENGTDWKEIPSRIDLPHSDDVREWLDVSEYWGAMMNLESNVFEQLVPSIDESEWPVIRAAQYAMASINGEPRASHVMLFTHAAWSLADKGLVPQSLAALQVHRMLRQYLERR